MTEVSLSASGIYAQPAMELGYDPAGRPASLSLQDPCGGGSGGGGSVAVDSDFTCDAASRVAGVCHTYGLVGS